MLRYTNNMEAITQAQVSMIKNNIIWLSGKSSKPSTSYLKWWELQEVSKMEDAINTLSKFEASIFISEAVQGNWSNVQHMMSQLLKGEFKHEDELEKQGLYRNYNGSISVGKMTSEIIN